MNILIMHATVSNHDAIGNDIEMMANVLAKKNSVYIYSEDGKNPRLTYVTYPKAMSIAKDPEAVIIYHHSVFWQGGYEILKQAKARIIFKYHKITPPYFFKKFSKKYYIGNAKGILQLKFLQHDFPNAYWLCDTKFSVEDLSRINIKKTKVAPLLNEIEEFKKNTLPDPNTLRELKGKNSINILSFGEFLPNNGHLLLLDILYIYKKTYGNNIKLRIVGKIDKSLKEYNEILDNKIKECGLTDNVKFINEATNESLCALYEASDIFLCTSLFESFYAPILTAQLFRLPVIALRSSAVKESIGNDQLALERDIRKFVAAIRIVVQKRDVRDFLTEKGLRNFSRIYLNNNVESYFISCIDKILENKFIAKGHHYINRFDPETLDKFVKVYKLFKSNLGNSESKEKDIISDKKFIEYMTY